MFKEDYKYGLTGNLTSNRIYIYGMGKKGIQTYLRLIEHGYKICGFIDSNAKKQECQLGDLACVSLELFQKNMETGDLVVVAIEQYMPVINKLKEVGIENLVSYKELWDVLEICYEPINDYNNLKCIFEKICKES